MDEDALQRIVDSLASRLSRSVALDDPGMRLLAASRHFGDEDQARLLSLVQREMPAENSRFALSHGISSSTRAQSIGPSPELGASARVCVPVRCYGALFGYLWLIDPDATLNDADLAFAEKAAHDAGLVLYRRVLHNERAREREEMHLRRLLSADTELRAQACVEVDDERALTTPNFCAVVVAEVETSHGLAAHVFEMALRGAAENAVRVLPPRSSIHLIEGRQLVLLVTGAVALKKDIVLDIAQRVADRVQQMLPAGPAVKIGIGSVGPHLTHAVSSVNEAQQAIRASRVLSTFGSIVDWDELGIYGLLLRLAPQEFVATDYLPALVRLRDGDRHGKLLETIETYLDKAGDVARTSDALHIHRTTLYYRLSKAEELAGVSLDSGEDRLMMHLGIKLARLSGALDTPTGTS